MAPLPLKFLDYQTPQVAVPLATKPDRRPLPPNSELHRRLRPDADSGRELHRANGGTMSETVNTVVQDYRDKVKPTSHLNLPVKH